MKKIILLIVFAFIYCTPRENVDELLANIRQQRYTKIINCIKEKDGSETLIKLFEENKNLKFGRAIQYNKDITKRDKDIFHDCRKNALDLKDISNILYSKKE